MPNESGWIDRLDDGGTDIGERVLVFTYANSKVEWQQTGKGWKGELRNDHS